MNTTTQDQTQAVAADGQTPKVQNAPKRFKKQAGNVLITTIIGIIITAILDAGAVMGLKWIDDAKVSTELDELTGLKTAVINQAVAMGGNFSAMDTGTLAQLNFFPALRVTGTGNSTVVLNQWKGTVAAVPATTISASDSIAFTYTGVPTYACRAIVQQASNVAIAISIGGSVVKSNGGTLNLATALTQCTAGADNVTMIYTFSR